VLVPWLAEAIRLLLLFKIWKFLETDEEILGDPEKYRACFVAAQGVGNLPPRQY
jgi:hypothetical protein